MHPKTKWWHVSVFFVTGCRTLMHKQLWNSNNLSSMPTVSFRVGEVGLRMTSVLEKMKGRVHWMVSTFEWVTFPLYEGGMPKNHAPGVEEQALGKNYLRVEENESLRVVGEHSWRMRLHDSLYIRANQIIFLSRIRAFGYTRYITNPLLLD